MPDPTQPVTPPDAGGSSPPANPDPKGDKGTSNPPASTDTDLSKLPADQLAKVLENPELFKLPRIQELLQAQKDLKKFQDDASKQGDKALEEQKKYQELAEKRGAELEASNKRNQDLLINQALINLLSKESVVDLDGALKLVDRSKLSVDESGEVQGAQEAFDALKSEKAYLFSGGGQPNVGNPSNPSGGSGDQPKKFKESQITPQFYKENKEALDEAGRTGNIEMDVTGNRQSN